MKHKFIPLNSNDNLTIINPYGCVGVITLWSKQDYIIDRFRSAGVDLDKDSSHIAAFGNLYGNGLKHLLVNLLYNPQIRLLIVCGSNRSDSYGELNNFFNYGVEPCTELGVDFNTIIGTKRPLPKILIPGLFRWPPAIVYYSVQELYFDSALRHFFNNEIRYRNYGNGNYLRIQIDLPEIKFKHFPSNPRGHTIIKETPIDAWKELIFCLNRFGHLTDLGAKKGKRIELQNVKVVVEKPSEDSVETLEKYGFDLNELKEYQNTIEDGDKKADLDYTYGNRLRKYFKIDGISECVKRLTKNPQDRRSYMVLWDAGVDLTITNSKSAPCFTTLYARVFEGKLTLTATFRVHNAVSAWLKNFYAIMRIQEIVVIETGIDIGAITMISHSISINPNDIEQVEHIVNEKVFDFEEDPNGEFIISIESGHIVATHTYKGEVLKRYTSKKAERIQYELKHDRAISDIGHAIYIGRELAKAETCLKDGQDEI